MFSLLQDDPNISRRRGEGTTALDFDAWTFYFVVAMQHSYGLRRRGVKPNR
jgi:hypothetical protein